MLEELRGEPGAQVVALGVEQRRRLVPDGVSASAEDRVEDRAHGSGEIARVARVVDEDPVLGEGERIAGGRTRERQAVVAGEHRRASRPAADRTARARPAARARRSRGGRRSGRRRRHGPGDELGGEGRGVGGRFGLGLVLGIGVRRRPRRPRRRVAVLPPKPSVIARRSASSMPYRSKQRSSISAWIAASSASTARTRSAQAAARAASVSPVDLQQRRQREGVRGLGAGVEAALQRPGAAGERARAASSAGVRSGTGVRWMTPTS